jgi:ankyrin repeat protein/WD40 repeat protein
MKKTKGERKQTPAPGATAQAPARGKPKATAGKVPESFFQAALQGTLQQIEAGLEGGVDPNARRGGGPTALMFAAHASHEDIVDRLLTRGADPDLKDANGYTALMIAAKAGRDEIARRLIAARADVNARAELDLTALILACQSGRAAIVKLLLENGADANAVTSRGAPSLIFSVAEGHEEIVALLLSHGANVNAAEMEAGHTPLIVAAASGRAGLIQLLLDHGADMKARAKQDKTALMMACGNGHLDAARLLIAKGADVNAVETELGMTALMAAAVSGNEAAVEALLGAGANVDAQSKSGHTALMYACRQGSENAVRRLLEAKANVFLKNDHREDAMAHAKAGDHDDIVELLADALRKQSEASPEKLRDLNGEQVLNLCSFGDSYVEQVRALLKQGANLEVRNRRGFTPLLMAAYSRCPEIARVLIEHGADLNAVEDTGGTPLYWACFGGHPGLVQTFLDRGAKLTPKIWEAAQNNGGDEVIEVLMAAAVQRWGAPAPRIPCDCEVLTNTTRPSDAQSRGTFTIVGEDVHEGWSEIYGLCHTCRRRWKVTEDTSYHYTTFAWEELKKACAYSSEFAEVEAKLQPRALPFSQYLSMKVKMTPLIRQNPKAARMAAETVVFFDPDDGLAWLVLGMACDVTGDDGKAREILASVPKRGFDAKQVTEMQEFLQQLLKHSEHRLLRYGSEFVKPLVGESPDDLFAAAVARGAGGDPVGARAILERVVGLKPDHFDAWFNLGISYLETAEAQKALPCFERSLSISPDNHTVQYQLGVARERAGDKTGALKAYKDASKSKPVWGGQRDHSAQIKEALLRLGKPKKAHLKGGHKRDVNCVTFSADGKTLASGSLDQTIRLWEPSTGKPLARLGGHANGVDCLAFSPDGRYLASRECLSNACFLWDLASETHIRTWSGGSGSVFQIAFSPDSRLLAVEADKTAVALVDTEARSEVRRMTGHADEITCTAFHPKGDLLASGSRDLTVRIWEVSSGREVQRFEGHTKVLGSVAFSPDGRLFATGGYDGLISIREVDGWKEVRSILINESAMRSINFSTDGRLAYFIAQHTVQTCDLQSGEVKVLIPEMGVISSFALSPDKRLAATGHSEYDDQRLHVWDVGTQREVWRI